MSSTCKAVDLIPNTAKMKTNKQKTQEFITQTQTHKAP
jgi:hypothetical protein